MFTVGQLIAHGIGDYVLQSHWMATQKTQRSLAALCHVLAYAVPFLFLKPSLLALVVIIGSHFVIDRWRLARYVVWAKNWLLCPFWQRNNFLPYQVEEVLSETTLKVNSTLGLRNGAVLTIDPMEQGLAPGSLLMITDERRTHARSWHECQQTGYPADTPPWLATWLLIICDNLLHIVCNAVALRYL